MKITSSLQNFLIRSLAESVTVEVMEAIVKELVPGYDLRKRTGFPLNIPIPNRDAARQICNDIISLNIFPHFVSLLIEINTNGYFGRRVRVSYLREMIKEVYEHGFIYDSMNKIFVENPDVRRTRNWGVLRNSQEYVITFLRLDIVGNSELVRKYPEDVINATYDDLLGIVQTSVDTRNGRIWNWEGDGGLVAFYFANKNKLATLSGMEILHELFIYNQMKNRLEHPIGVRCAIHTGFCNYTENIEDLKTNETIKTVIDIESKFTQPNSLTVSLNIHSSLERELANHFNIIAEEKGTKFYNYHLKWEQ
jgi:hypothetical protein